MTEQPTHEPRDGDLSAATAAQIGSDLRCFAEVFGDLGDDEVMAAAWSCQDMTTD